MPGHAAEQGTQGTPNASTHACAAAADDGQWRMHGRAQQQPVLSNQGILQRTAHRALAYRVAATDVTEPEISNSVCGQFETEMGTEVRLGFQFLPISRNGALGAGRGDGAGGQTLPVYRVDQQEAKDYIFGLVEE